MDIYEFARGPLAWVSILIFIFGSLSRTILLLYSAKTEPVLNPSPKNRDAIRSILHGIIPFSSITMRRQPLFLTITFIFHICVLLLPIFLLAHTVLWYESWGILWWSLPDTIADLMAIWVILACAYFIFRRFSITDAKRVTRPIDFLILIIILVTFLAGFLAYHQWGPYRPILILHIISSEVLLVMIPFSKLGHMLFFWSSRAYMGAEFGKYLNARDW